MARTRVSEEHFTVVYDGRALAEHTMDVKDLAPALLSMAQAFHQAQHVLEPGAPKVNLSIRAFDGGSFEVSMLLTEASSILGQIGEFLTGSTVDRVEGAATLLTAVLGSVKAVQWVRGRRIKGKRTNPDGSVKLVLEDGDEADVPASVAPLVLDIEYRRHLTEIVRPLSVDGITEFRVRDESAAVRVSVHSDDLPSFAVPDVKDEDLGVTRRDVTLQLLGVEFDGRKWRFTEGATSITAAIEDEAFARQIERQEVTFGKNDLLRARLRTRQYRDAQGKLKAEHAIEQVLRHIDGGRQLPLDFDEDD